MKGRCGRVRGVWDRQAAAAPHLAGGGTGAAGRTVDTGSLANRRPRRAARCSAI